MNNLTKITVLVLSVLCVMLLAAVYPRAAYAYQVFAAQTEDPTGQTPEDPQPACKTTGEHEYSSYTFNGNGKHLAVCGLCGETFECDCEWADPCEYLNNENGTHSVFCVLCGGETVSDCDYEQLITLPTQVEPGYTVFTCKNCCYSYTGLETAPEAERAESPFLGDIDASGAVDASDARSALRAAVSLEAIPNDMLPYADIDFDGRIAAADARGILRMSVGLDSLMRHDFSVEVHEEATCVTPGSLTAACRYCGYSADFVIPAAGHKYEESERTDATCTQEGSVTLICSVCGDKKTSVLRTVSHQWVAATATTPKHCSVCGEVVAGWTEVNGKSYYFTTAGTLVVNRIVDNYYVDEDGVRCNDRVIQLAVDYVLANGGSGTAEQKLRKCYDKMVATCKYATRTGLASTSNLPDKAEEMFTKQVGHCYSYASMFAYIAKVLGYSVRVNSGEILSASGKMAAHGWTEIYIDGAWYMFDVTSHIYRGIDGYQRTHANFPIKHTSGTLFNLVTKDGAAYWTK